MTPISKIEDALAELCADRGFDDWSLRLITAHECAWSCEVTVTLHEGAGAGDPDQRHTSRAVGSARAEDAAADAWGGLLDWLARDGRLNDA